MRNRTIRRAPGGMGRIFLTVLFLLAYPLCSSKAGFASQPKLLILDSYHQGFPWSDEERAGLLSRLQEVYPDLDPPIEHFDAKRFPEQNDLVRVKDNLIVKYRNQRFDLLVVFDNPALNTLLKYRKELFPEAPIVFAGINDYQPSMIAGRTKVTGVAENLDIAGGLRTALKLHPEAKEVLVIHDYTVTGLSVRRETEAILPEFQGRIKVRFNPPATFDEILAELKAMPADGLALILSFVTDRSGYSPPQAEGVRLLTSNTSIPVYALHETRLGHGIVGGILLSGREQGRRAGDIALRVLDGEDPSKIPVDTKSTALPMFDYKQLARFHIPLSVLPKGSILINRPESLYEKNKTLVFGTLAVLILLLLMVTAMAGAILRQRRAEKEAWAKEEQFRTLFENAGDAIFIIDLQGHFLNVNHVACERLGYGHDELLKMTNKNVNSPEYAALISDRIGVVRQQGQAIFETAHVRKDGKSIPTEISSRIIRYSGQSAILTIARDITERKRVEDALRENEEQYRSLFETSTNAILIRNREGRMTMVNEAAISLLGATKAADLIGKAYLDFVHPEDRDLSAERVEKIFQIALSQPDPYQEATKTILPREHRMIRIDGNMIYVESTAAAFRHRGELFIQGIFRNITERKQAEESLKRSEEEAKRLAQESAIVAEIGRIIGSTLNIEEVYGRFAEQVQKLISFDRISINLIDHEARAATSAYSSGRGAKGRQIGDVFPLEGTAAEEVARTHSGLLLHLRDRAELERRFPGLVPSFQAGHRSMMVVPLISKGKVIAVLYFGSMKSDFFNDRNLKSAELIGAQIAGAIANAQLFTERQRLEERLRRVEKMEALGTLAGGVAHDLNNVLGVLVGYSELLQMEIAQGSPLRRHVSNILQSGQRAAAIVQDLLTLARRGVAVSEVVNLNDLISDHLKTLEFEKLKAYHPQVTFKTDLDKDLMNVKGSPVHLSKTIMNLLSNAAEAIPDHGEVTLLTENRHLDKPIAGYDHIREGDYAVLGVSDNGKGISAQDMGNIFEPFYTKKVMGRSGTGLGLPVVWGTVKDHGGYIDVRSEEGKGSAFTLYFPVTREERAEDRPSIPRESYQGRGESILVVDDVKEQRELATAMLRKLGYRVRAVSSGEEALAFLRTNRVDLLVLDMIMEPGMDGLETYRNALEINPKQRAVIVSGYSETGRVGAAQQLGAGAYVKKPYILEKMGSAVRRELDR